MCNHRAVEIKINEKRRVVAQRFSRFRRHAREDVWWYSVSMIAGEPLYRLRLLVKCTEYIGWVLKKKPVGATDLSPRRIRTKEALHW